MTTLCVNHFLKYSIILYNPRYKYVMQTAPTTAPKNAIPNVISRLIKRNEVIFYHIALNFTILLTECSELVDEVSLGI